MNKEERKLYMQEYRKTKKWKSSKSESDKKYYQNNKESIIFRNKIWKENNLEKFYQINKEWAINNPEKIKEAQIKYRKNNPSYKIRNLFHNLKRRFQNGHGKEDHKVIKNYIESLFIEDMNWSNIEIDHKIPITWFKSLTPLIYINDLRNLQPLFIKDNRNKAATYCHPIEKEYYNLIETYIKPTRIKQILETISL
jgi:hypothetical protein